jgi:RHS repeat-associated protein
VSVIPGMAVPVLPVPSAGTGVAGAALLRVGRPLASRVIYNQAGDLTSASDAQNSGGTNTQCSAYNDMQELTAAWTDKGATTATTDAGNQTSLSHGGIGTCTNTTPSAGNLGGRAPYWESWTYDNLGDRLTQDIHNPSGSTSGDVHQTLTYAGAGTTAAAQPDAATTIKTQYGTTGASTTTTAVYNSSGQEASDTSTTSGATPPPTPDVFSALTYDAQGQVASATMTSGKSTFLYDAGGSLMVEADPTATTVYLDGGTEQVTYTVSTAKTTGVRFYPSPDGTTTVRSSAGTISYDIANQQGTSGESVNASTLAITRRYYDPYGNAVGTPSAWPDNKAFVGQPQDITTALGLLGAREYNPATGNFTSLDPVFEAGEPAQMGGYAYAANNPTTDSDPTGLTCTKDQNGNIVGNCYRPTPTGGGGTTSTCTANPSICTTTDPTTTTPVSSSSGGAGGGSMCDRFGLDCGYTGPEPSVPGGAQSFFGGVGWDLVSLLQTGACVTQPAVCAAYAAADGHQPSSIYTNWMTSLGVDTAFNSNWGAGIIGGNLLAASVGGAAGAAADGAAAAADDAVSEAASVAGRGGSTAAGSTARVPGLPASPEELPGKPQVGWPAVLARGDDMQTTGDWFNQTVQPGIPSQVGQDVAAHAGDIFVATGIIVVIIQSIQRLMGD